MIPIDKKRLVTLAGTLVLAGVVVAAGVYGPSVWKVFRQQSAITDPVVIQTPEVNDANDSNGLILPEGTAPPTTPGATPTITVPTAPTESSIINEPPKADVGTKSKYREPDTKLINLAPSVTEFFGETGLSNDAKTLVFGSAWNIHQYVDGYLYGPAAGPQMNEGDIKRYIVFHKSLLDKQYKNEASASKAVNFTNYFDILLNSGIDAFDSKDKVRIEQFHQGIHDFDSHLLRQDANAKIYGATPFATKRT